MSTTLYAQILRAKILGALLRDARLAAEAEIDECAQAIGVSNEEFEAYELGGRAISLPELECVAYYLNTPLENFWGIEQQADEDGQKQQPVLAQLIQIRHRMVGARLRQARQEADLTIENLAEQTGLKAQTVEAYELGQEPIPIPQLEVLCNQLNRSVREFQDQHGPVGEWSAKKRARRDFQEMPLELQSFVSKPVNRPYLELAIRLSEMSVDRLRSVAEGLLEITY